MPVELSVPGHHNVLNALAALAACRAAGVELPEAAAALADFSGAGRRFEPHGTTAGGARVFDDYAHHPTEVRATLEAARTAAQAAAPGRLLPAAPLLAHAALAREFGRALALADVVVVLDVYRGPRAARGLPGRDRAAGRGGGRRRRRRPAGLVAARRSTTRSACWRRSCGEGDLLVTLGAGDVDRAGAGADAA